MNGVAFLVLYSISCTILKEPLINPSLILFYFISFCVAIAFWGTIESIIGRHFVHDSAGEATGSHSSLCRPRSAAIGVTVLLDPPVVHS